MSEKKAKYSTISISKTGNQPFEIWYPTQELAFFDVPIKSMNTESDVQYRAVLFQKYRKDDGTSTWQRVPHKGIWNG